MVAGPWPSAVGHGQEPFAQFRVEVARRHRGQVRLQQHVLQGRGQVFAEDPQGVVGLFGGDRGAQLAERTGADQAEHLGLGEDTADQRAEAAGHPGLRPLGTLQHGGGIQHGGLPVGRRGLEGEFVQDFQDPFPDHRGVRPLRLGGERIDGGPGRRRGGRPGPGRQRSPAGPRGTVRARWPARR